jgi:pilus assembly protein Flp/PilA
MLDRFEQLRSWVRRALVSERGASLVEYALLVALIALVCVAAVGFFGDETSESFSVSASHLGSTN